MGITQVYDLWHPSRPSESVRASQTPCEHSTNTKPLYASQKHGSGKRWQVRWRDHTGKQCKENFDRKPDALRRAAAIKADMDRGQYVDPRAGLETLESVAARWQEGALHKGSTVESVDQAFRNHINPLLGHRTVSGLKTSDIQGWVNDRNKTLAATTVRKMYAYLRVALQTAVMDGIIAKNPCQGVKLPPVRQQEIHPLHPEVVQALVKGAPERYRVCLLVAAATGLRQGELWGLELESVDFAMDKREIRVRQQLVTPDKGDSYVSTPKSHHSSRTVPVAPLVLNAIRAHLEQFPLTPVVIDDRTDPRKPEERKAKLIFLNGDNRPIRRGQWSHLWSDTVRRANTLLEASASELRVPKGATMHDLRHFYASLLIHHGESVKVVQRNLGHAKASMTLDVYTHLWDAVEDTTRDAVTQGLGFTGSALEVPPVAPELLQEPGKPSVS
ncbi:tyrosine-type recombinase/integrase [Streptomyces sp. NPDC058718]|uniref:tyrosine-type recombinase/integrase n=1 Tax=Streptomyces sp. NPDC058718 TaxID=3346610 RepID=UPI003694D87A